MAFAFSAFPKQIKDENSKLSTDTGITKKLDVVSFSENAEHMIGILNQSLPTLSDRAIASNDTLYSIDINPIYNFTCEPKPQQFFNNGKTKSIQNDSSIFLRYFDVLKKSNLRNFRNSNVLTSNEIILAPTIETANDSRKRQKLLAESISSRTGIKTVLASDLYRIQEDVSSSESDDDLKTIQIIEETSCEKKLRFSIEKTKDDPSDPYNWVEYAWLSVYSGGGLLKSETAKKSLLERAESILEKGVKSTPIGKRDKLYRSLLWTDLWTNRDVMKSFLESHRVPPLGVVVEEMDRFTGVDAQKRALELLAVSRGVHWSEWGREEKEAFVRRARFDLEILWEGLSRSMGFEGQREKEWIGVMIASLWRWVTGNRGSDWLDKFTSSQIFSVLTSEGFYGGGSTEELRRWVPPLPVGAPDLTAVQSGLEWKWLFYVLDVMLWKIIAFLGVGMDTQLTKTDSMVIVCRESASIIQSVNEGYYKALPEVSGVSSFIGNVEFHEWEIDKALDWMNPDVRSASSMSSIEISKENLNAIYEIVGWFCSSIPLECVSVRSRTALASCASRRLSSGRATLVKKEFLGTFGRHCPSLWSLFLSRAGESNPDAARKAFQSLWVADEEWSFQNPGVALTMSLLELRWSSSNSHLRTTRRIVPWEEVGVSDPAIVWLCAAISPEFVGLEMVGEALRVQTWLKALDRLDNCLLRSRSVDDVTTYITKVESSNLCLNEECSLIAIIVILRILGGVSVEVGIKEVFNRIGKAEIDVKVANVIADYLLSFKELPQKDLKKEFSYLFSIIDKYSENDDDILDEYSHKRNAFSRHSNIPDFIKIQSDFISIESLYVPSIIHSMNLRSFDVMKTIDIDNNSNIFPHYSCSPLLSPFCIRLSQASAIFAFLLRPIFSLLIRFRTQGIPLELVSAIRIRLHRTERIARRLSNCINSNHFLTNGCPLGICIISVIRCLLKSKMSLRLAASGFHCCVKEVENFCRSDKCTKENEESSWLRVKNQKFIFKKDRTENSQEVEHIKK